MKFELKLDDILELFPEAKTEGNYNGVHLFGISSLDQAQEGDLSFLGNSKYRSQVFDTKASCLLIPDDFDGEPRENQLFLRIDDPSYGLAVICKFIESKLFPPPCPGIHPSAFVEETASIHPSSSIGPFCYIGKNVNIGSNSHILSHCHIGDEVRIGSDTKLHPGVKVLSRCKVGNKVILNAGVVLGSEGYGFDQVKGQNLKTPHLGIVVIEDHVEIGANTCIDRARFDESRIGLGTKIDNLVQIGHNVKVGKDCLIVAQVGIAGSVNMEDQVVVGGQAGFAGHLRIGKGAKIAGQAGITKDVEPGAFLKGNPALPLKLSQKISILQRRLPELFNRFDQIGGNK